VQALADLFSRNISVKKVQVERFLDLLARDGKV
jgi:hypothetical protein